jgi:hypothetical protein
MYRDIQVTRKSGERIEKFNSIWLRITERNIEENGVEEQWSIFQRLIFSEVLKWYKRRVAQRGINWMNYFRIPDDIATNW